MKKIRIIILSALLTVLTTSCAVFEGATGVLRAAEVSTTLANLDPLFDQTVSQIDGNWASFSAEDRAVLERSYRDLLQVRDLVKGHIDDGSIEDVILDIDSADLLYADLKTSYLNARDVVFSKMETFSRMDQIQLVRLDTRMMNLDFTIQKMREEAETKDITQQIKSILATAVQIIQVYRMAKDPLGLTYADRESE